MKAYVKLSALFLALTLLWSLAACSMYGERQKVAVSYTEARRAAITVSRPEGSENLSVFAVMVDMDKGDHVETLICYSDGTVHLYHSTGETYTDLQKNDPALTALAQALLMGASEHLDRTYWQEKTDLALPDIGHDLVYLKGDKGIYTLPIEPQKLADAGDTAKAIYGLYATVYQAASAASQT